MDCSPYTRNNGTVRFHDMESRVRRTIRNFGMIAPDEHVNVDARASVGSTQFVAV